METAVTLFALTLPIAADVSAFGADAVRQTLCERLRDPLGCHDPACRIEAHIASAGSVTLLAEVMLPYGVGPPTLPSSLEKVALPALVARGADGVGALLGVTLTAAPTVRVVGLTSRLLRTAPPPPSPPPPRYLVAGLPSSPASGALPGGAGSGAARGSALDGLGGEGTSLLVGLCALCAALGSLVTIVALRRVRRRAAASAAAAAAAAAKSTAVDSDAHGAPSPPYATVGWWDSGGADDDDAGGGAAASASMAPTRSQDDAYGRTRARSPQGVPAPWAGRVGGFDGGGPWPYDSRRGAPPADWYAMGGGAVHGVAAPPPYVQRSPRQRLMYVAELRRELHDALHADDARAYGACAAPVKFVDLRELAEGGEVFTGVTGGIERAGSPQLRGDGLEPRGFGAGDERAVRRAGGGGRDGGRDGGERGGRGGTGRDRAGRGGGSMRGGRPPPPRRPDRRPTSPLTPTSQVDARRATATRRRSPQGQGGGGRRESHGAARPLHGAHAPSPTKPTDLMTTSAEARRAPVSAATGSAVGQAGDAYPAGKGRDSGAYVSGRRTLAPAGRAMAGGIIDRCGVTDGSVGRRPQTDGQYYSSMAAAQPSDPQGTAASGAMDGLRSAAPHTAPEQELEQRQGLRVR